MTGGELVLAGAAGWTVLGCTGGYAWSFAAARLKRRPATEHAVQVLGADGQWHDDDGTVRTHWQPPVPPPARCLADYFADIPSDCMSDDAIRPLFDDIVNGQFS